MTIEQEIDQATMDVALAEGRMLKEHANCVNEGVRCYGEQLDKAAAALGEARVHLAQLERLREKNRRAVRDFAA